MGSVASKERWNEAFSDRDLWLSWRRPARCGDQVVVRETQAACGNGELERDEQCDDGNEQPDDACTDGCKTACCGAPFCGTI